MRERNPGYTSRRDRLRRRKAAKARIFISAETESRAGSAAEVQELVTSSRSSRAIGDYALALADIERAVRIEPRNPRLWLALGEIHLLQDDSRQVAAMARKAERRRRGRCSLGGSGALVGKGVRTVNEARKLMFAAWTRPPGN